jgi:hypothetical protein
MGNEAKNQKIESLTTRIDAIPPNNIPRIKRLFIIKEIGDVLQVWLYLALITMMGWNTTDVVMVTTDSVVYLFCILLRLSCIYTGERIGVRPGCCTLRHYLAGEPNYLKKYENMIEVYATRLIQHNTSISMGLLRLIAEPTNFDYYIEHTGNIGYRRTIASRGLTSLIQSTQVNPLIRRFITIIDTSTERVKLALKLVKTYIASRGNDVNAAQAYNDARTEMQRAREQRNSIQLDERDDETVQNAVREVATAAAQALDASALMLQRVLDAAQAVNTAATAAGAAGAAGAAAETAINTGYTHFCSVVDRLKQESILTLLPNKRYIMLPGPLLTAFVNFTNPPPNSVTLIPDVSRIIAGAVVAADAQKQFNRAIRGGGRGQRGGAPEEKKQRVDPPNADAVAVAAPLHPLLDQDPNTTNIANEDTSIYNECLVACYIQATRGSYVNLHALGDQFTLKGNPVCSIHSFDEFIQSQPNDHPFDFNTMYDQQVQSDPDGWRVNDTYGNITYELQIAFALDYDRFANALIHEQNLEFDETAEDGGRTPNRKLLEDYYDSLSSDPVLSNHISRSQILARGKQLLQLLHLAEDITDEISSLTSIINERLKIFPPGTNEWIVNVDNRYSIYPNPLGRNNWIIDTRFHSWLLRDRRGIRPVPSFNPSTLCGGTRDPITYSLIDPALAIEITVGRIRKCYQITTIIDYLIKSDHTLDTLTDLSTQNVISDPDKQNIANFIIMMYKLTPEVQRKLGRFLVPQITNFLDEYNRIMDPVVGEPAAGGMKRSVTLRGQSETKRKTIKRKLHYKNKSKNQKIVNKHRMTRRSNRKTRRRTRKH